MINVRRRRQRAIVDIREKNEANFPFIHPVKINDLTDELNGENIIRDWKTKIALNQSPEFASLDNNEIKLLLV